MAEKREWTWTYDGLTMGVILDESGNTLTWWGILVRDYRTGSRYSGRRTQPVKDFIASGPSYDNITVWELENPDYIDNMYNPFYDAGEPDEVDGPRLHQIPPTILAELCEQFGVSREKWPPPPNTCPDANDRPAPASEKTNATSAKTVANEPDSSPMKAAPSDMPGTVIRPPPKGCDAESGCHQSPGSFQKRRKKVKRPKGAGNLAGIASRTLVRLKKFADVLEFAKPWLASETDLGRIEHALEGLYSHSFGYSDLHNDLVAYVPSILKLSNHLCKTLDDFLLLCREIPKIIENLPREGESTMLGWSHWCDLSVFENKAKTARTLAELLKDI